jgi:diketogulonate reductase-like aldo/keto reductase
VRYKQLGSGSGVVSAIGQGQSIRGYRPGTAEYEDQVENLRLGTRLGMTLVDTAPAYGDGRSEEAVGKAVRDCRDKVCIATKLRPAQNRKEEISLSVAESLERLAVEYIDLLQVHWPSPNVPMEETMTALAGLVKEAKVRQIGVSNFSFEELVQVRKVVGPTMIASLQVEYNLLDRGVEDEVLPYCEREDITVLAYTPLCGGRIANGADQLAVLRDIGEECGKTPAQVALRWLISHEPVVAIPHSSNPQRLTENAASADFDLTDEMMERIDIECRSRVQDIETERICPVARYGPLSYRTVGEAVANSLGLSPNPVELAEQIRQGAGLAKPVRVVRMSESEDYEYGLTEGRLRYWAWVIAFDGKRPIPALFDESRPLDAMEN